MLIDGFIEAIDLTNVPKRLQRPLRRLLAPLVGQPGLHFGALERRLTLAEDVAGATIRSTLAPGRTSGGTMLVIQARYKPISGSITFDNRQSASFRKRSATLQLSVASLLGKGEELYGYVSTDPFHAPGHALGESAPRKTYGVGAIVPLGGNGTSVNVEATKSVTRPLGGFFRTRDTFIRDSIRLTHPLVRSRTATWHVVGSLDLVRERNEAVDFGIALSRDRYMIPRLATDANASMFGGFFTGGLTVSHGLPDTRGEDDFPSRAGATGVFTKIEGQVSVSYGLPLGFQASASARGQKVVQGVPPSAEIFSIDGTDALAGITAGALSSDEGIVGRVELRRPIASHPGRLDPFAYFAAGRLHARVSTAFDIRGAHGFGGGATLTLPIRQTSLIPFLTVEYGQVDGAAFARPVHRVSVNAGLRF